MPYYLAPVWLLTSILAGASAATTGANPTASIWGLTGDYQGAVLGVSSNTTTWSLACPNTECVLNGMTVTQEPTALSLFTTSTANGTNSVVTTNIACTFTGNTAGVCSWMTSGTNDGFTSSVGNIFTYSSDLPHAQVTVTSGQELLPSTSATSATTTTTTTSSLSSQTAAATTSSHTGAAIGGSNVLGCSGHMAIWTAVVGTASVAGLLAVLL